jgi:acetyltransferase-like isoleucine patch superfamily enzyme
MKMFFRFIKILLSSIKKTFLIARKNEIEIITTYVDMVRCGIKYDIGTNIYVDNKLWEMNESKKNAFLKKIQLNNLWWKKYFNNRKFLQKYTSLKYETSFNLMNKRKKAYIRQYDLPESFNCQYGVIILGEHFGSGKIIAGENLCIARNVDIDITGDVIFGNDVMISEGTKILTHAHDYDDQLGKEIISSDMAYLTPLKVGDDVHFGAKSIILPGCNRIGSHSVIGAGAVVTKDVPEWAIVAGNPAKVIKMREKK